MRSPSDSTCPRTFARWLASLRHGAHVGFFGVVRRRWQMMHLPAVRASSRRCFERAAARSRHAMPLVRCGSIGSAPHSAHRPAASREARRSAKYPGRLN